MNISNNRISNSQVNNDFQINRRRINKSSNKNYDAFRVELSTKALLSEEYNSKSNNFPIADSEALIYTKQHKIIYK